MSVLLFHFHHLFQFSKCFLELICLFYWLFLILNFTHSLLAHFVHWIYSYIKCSGMFQLSFLSLVTVIVNKRTPFDQSGSRMQHTESAQFQSVDFALFLCQSQCDIKQCWHLDRVPVVMPLQKQLSKHMAAKHISSPTLRRLTSVTVESSRTDLSQFPRFLIYIQIITLESHVVQSHRHDDLLEYDKKWQQD